MKVSTILLCSVLIFLIPTIYTGIPTTRTGPCTPGELVWVDCNLCTCNPQGMPNPVCAKMWCQPTPALKQAKADEEARAKQLEQERQTVELKEEEVKEEEDVKEENKEEVVIEEEVREAEVKVD
uniref:Putative serine/threonine-protein kinase kinx rhodnius neglectus n=1 Tax=Rhodnius prolixus TaxID=13249 RepID=A0A4V0Y8U0_RHOPR